MTAPDRKHPSAAFWAIVVVVVVLVLVAYPLSLGPVTRLANEATLPEWIGYLYVPLMVVVESSPEPMQSAFQVYTNLWLPEP